MLSPFLSRKENKGWRVFPKPWIGLIYGELIFQVQTQSSSWGWQRRGLSPLGAMHVCVHVCMYVCNVSAPLKCRESLHISGSCGSQWHQAVVTMLVTITNILRCQCRGTSATSSHIPGCCGIILGGPEAAKDISALHFLQHILLNITAARHADHIHEMLILVNYILGYLAKHYMYCEFQIDYLY